jgi:hypothetical protein
MIVKMIFPKGLPKGPSGIELFNLDRDPSEKNNLFKTEAVRRARMLSDIKKHYGLKISGIPHYREGAKTFKAPEDWVIPG